MTDEQIKALVESVISKMDLPKQEAVPKDRADEGSIPDIREENYRATLDVENPANAEEFLRIKANTDARMGLGRAGCRYKTRMYLRMLADHAGAMDAVQNEPDESIIDENGFFRVQTMCENKDVYMTRPDLGRLFSDEMKDKMAKNCIMKPDVQIIASEGLSSIAFDRNITDVMQSMAQGLAVEGIKAGTPIYVRYSRVPAMDVITEIVKPKVTVIFIGERPGLSTYASLSAYMTYNGYVGMPESGRNVVSNIHANGTNPVEAGAHIASVVRMMIDQKASGTDLQLF